MKKNKNFILKDNETYINIADEILNSDIDCYTKYVNDFCHNRVLNRKKMSIIHSHPPCSNSVLSKKSQRVMCFHLPCLIWVIDDNYCSNHQDKKYDF